MYSIVVLIVSALLLVNVPPPAAAADESVKSQKQYRDDSAEFEELDAASPNEATEEDAPEALTEDEFEALTEDAPEALTEDGQIAPDAVFFEGCIFRPGRRVVINLRARGIVTYRVVPDRFFDVTLHVNYLGLRPTFFRDRFFEGGAESVRIRGPRRAWPVRVTIGGFRGSTGCFFFSARP
jgi:hypothetical protein